MPITLRSGKAIGDAVTEIVVRFRPVRHLPAGFTGAEEPAVLRCSLGPDRLSLSINNLLDEMPPEDATWSNYPYYDTSWFDSFGRSYFLQVTYKFGGKPLD